MSGSEQLNIDITAKDSASKVIDPLVKKVEGLEKIEPEIAVGADTKAASKAIDGIETDAKGLDKLDPEVSVTADTKSAAKDVETFSTKLAKLSDADQIVTLALRAGAAQSELTQLMTDVAQLDANDPTIDVKVDRINELTGELDGLKSKIESIASTSLDPDVQGKASGRLHDIEAGAGKAGDAVHSMAGNAVGDFAATTAGVGPLGEAIGQLTEGVLGGEIAFKDLGRAALGVGAIAGGILVLNKVMSEFQKAAKETAAIKTFHDDEIKGFTKSLTQGTNVLDDYVAKLKEAGKIDVKLDIPVIDPDKNKIKFITDISDSLLKAGANAEGFGSAVTGSDQDLAGFIAAVQTSNATAGEQRQIIEGATNAHKNYQTAVQDAASFNAKFTSSAEAAAQATAAQTAATEANAAQVEVAKTLSDQHAAAIDGVNTALAEQVSALQDTAQGYRDTQAAQEAMISSAENSADSQRAANDAFVEFGKVTKDNNATSADATDAAIKLAKANENAKDDAAAASGEIRTNTERVDSLNDSLLATASASATGRAEIVGYIGDLNGIPADKQTEIITALNKGDLDEAKRLINEASTTRTVAVEADASKFNADVTTAKAEAAKPVQVSVVYNPDTRKLKGPFAAGGTVGPEGGIAGEAGAEFAQLGGKGATVLLTETTVVPPGTKITSARKTRAILQRRIPRYANGTDIPAPLSVTGRPLVFQFNQNAPVYGVDDLNAHLEAWARKTAATISARKR